MRGMQSAGENAYGLKQRIGLPLGLVIFLLLLLIPPFGGIEPAAQRTLAVAALMAVWWITEALPLAATAMLPLLLFPLLGIADAQATSVNYANKNIFLFIGGFLLAFGLERWGLHRRFALRILGLVGGRPAQLLLAFMLVTWFLSMWISNTATTLMLLPVGLGVLAHLAPNGESNGGGGGNFREALMLGIAYAASLGGIATLIGTPPNIILKGYLETAFPGSVSISFAKWMALVLPLSLVFLFILWVMLQYLLKVGRKELGSGTAFVRDALKRLGRLSRGEWMMLTIFVLTALLWIFRADIDLGAFTIPGWAGLTPWPDLFHDSTVAMGMALLCFALPVSWRKGEFLLTWAEGRKLPWNIVLLFGGGFALAFGITNSGLDKFIGQQLAGIKVLPIVLVVAIIALLMTFLTEITSNTATTSALLPILGPLAAPLGVHPLVILLPATLSASFAFMLPVATPPNAIVFGSGYVRMGTMVRVGLWLNFTGVILTTCFVMLVQRFL
jgi:sodium-dependent dicarboxylate transporter 2/3/5